MEKLLSIIPLLAIFITIYFISYIIKIKSKPAELKWFIVFLISSLFYLVDIFINVNILNRNIVSFSIRCLGPIAVITVITFVNFLFTLFYGKKYKIYIAVLLYLIPILPYLYFFNTSYVIESIFYAKWGYVFKGGNIAKFLGPYNVLILLIALFLFLKEFKKTRDMYRRKMLKMLLFYLLIPLLVATIFDGIIVVDQFIHIPFGLSSLVALYFMSALFYIIVRYGLREPILEIDKNSIERISLFLFLLLFLIPLFVLFSRGKMVVYYFTLFIIFSIAIYSLVKRFLEKFFLKEKRRYDNIQKTIKSNLMLSTDINYSSQQFVDIVQYIMGAKYVLLYLFRDKMTCMYIKNQNNPVNYIEKKQNYKLYSFIQSLNDYLFLKKSLVRAKSIPASIKKYDAELIFPLKRNEKNIGFVLISSKQDASIFKQLEINILKDLVVHFNMLIINALLYQELSEKQELEIFKEISIYTSHEIKNLISGLNFLLGNFKKRFEKRKIPIKEYFINTIAETITQMSKLILNLKNPEYVKKRLVVKKINLVNCIKDVMKDIPVLKEHIKIVGNMSDRTLCINGDVSQIKQLLINLIRNSFDAIKGKENGSIKLDFFKKGSKVIVKIIDNGIGINKKYLRRNLFQPFTSTKKDGMGIGLYICKNIMKAHKGEIQIKSDLGKGTEVTLKFPE